MQVPKPTDEDKAAFRALVPDDPTVEVKPMFGNLGAFVNGNMFMGLLGSTVGLKLVDEESRAELSAIDGTGPFGPDGRTMGGYVRLPQAWLATPELAEPWVGRALSEVGALPPKAPKSKR